MPSLRFSVLAQCFWSFLILWFFLINVFGFASDIVFVYCWTYCLSVTTFKPWISGPVLCYLSVLSKESISCDFQCFRHQTRKNRLWRNHHLVILNCGHTGEKWKTGVWLLVRQWSLTRLELRNAVDAVVIYLFKPIYSSGWWCICLNLGGKTWFILMPSHKEAARDIERKWKKSC